MPDQDCRDMDGAGVLNIQVIEARNVGTLIPPKSAKKNLWVYCALHPKTEWTKKKTPSSESSKNPQWEHIFTYPDQKYRDLLENCAAQLSLDYGGEAVGHICFSAHPNRCDTLQIWKKASRSEILHWEEMLSKPGKILTKWHQLVKTLDERPMGIDEESIKFVNPFTDDLVSEPSILLLFDR